MPSTLVSTNKNKCARTMNAGYLGAFFCFFVVVVVVFIRPETCSLLSLIQSLSSSFS
jgi:hypothetical protein